MRDDIDCDRARESFFINCRECDIPASVKDPRSLVLILHPSLDVFLAVVAVLPIILGNLTGVAIQLGGTSMLIVVGVALDTTRSLDSYMTMRNHKGFLG